MLRSLRNKSKSFLFKIFFGIIILGFAAWGVGDVTGNKLSPVFKTENHEITYQDIIDDFNKARITTSGLMDTKSAVKNGVLNNVLIQNKIETLVNEETHNLDLIVAREFLKKKILDNEMFRDNEKNGIFSEKKFKTILSNNNLSEDEYLSKLETDILNDKILDPIKSFKKYDSEFSKKFLKWQKRNLNLVYTFTSFLSNKDIKPLTKKQKQDYYLKNKDKYIIPKVRNLSYLSFEPKMFEELINITPEQVEQSYNARIDEFNIPSSRNYYQIIFKNKNSAQDFYKKILKSNNFIDEAKKLNYKINDIKFVKVTQDDLPKSISDVIFNEYSNKIISPIKTNFGYHVIKITKINKKRIKTLDQVYSSLEKDLKKSFSVDKLYEQIDKINDLVFSGSTLEEISKIFKNLEIKKLKKISTKGYTYSSDRPIKTNIENNFLNKIWDLEINELSELLEINNEKFLLINIDKQINETQLGFERAKFLVKDDLLKEIIYEKTVDVAKKNFDDNSKSDKKTLKGLKRYENNNIENFFMPNVIDKIFKSKINSINNVFTSSGVLTYKVLKKNDINTLDKKELNIIDTNFENDLKKDLVNIFYKKLENYHNLKSDFVSLNELIN